MTAPGALVEFYHEKKVVCGLCLKADKKSLHLLNEENREIGVPPQRVVLSMAGFMNPSALREDVVAALRRAAGERESIKAGIAICDLWDLLCDEPGQYKVEELASTWFSGAVAPEQVSGMLRALNEDRIYFERKNDLYVANARERVTQLLESIQAEQNKIIEREAISAWLQRVWALRGGGGAASIARPDCLPKYLDWLEDVALHGPESSRSKEIQTVLAKAGISQRDAAFQVLVKAGVWSVHENLAIHRAKVPVTFSAALLEQAETYPAKITDGAWRHDGRVSLTAHAAVTIDDIHTVETDDALSLIPHERGWEVGIHIADPAEFIEQGSPLDREAMHRGTSIYFPDQKIPMLPQVIGTDVCSLVAGEERPALSVLAVLDDDGAVLETRIVESVVRVSRRLTYDAVDVALSAGNDEMLGRLHHLASSLRRRRLEGGAVFVPFPSVEVHVERGESGEPEVTVHREEHDTPSQILVSEFMILGNHAAARYLIDNGLPGVYRGQPPPSEPITYEAPFTALDGFRVRRFLKKSETSLEPIRHSGLGLDAYVQFTSPIRRYLDLALHRQIKTHLRQGQPVYTREDMERLAMTCGACSEQADSMERSRKSYWIYRHLESCLWQEQRATVLQVFPDRYHVQLTDTLVEADCASVSGASVSPGDQISVKIDIVFPRDSVVRVSALVS